MSISKPSGEPELGSSFADESEGATPSLLREFWDLLRYNKKWWLIPIFAVLLLAGLFIFLSGTVFAPFIYPLF
jgi:hypothetical protein